MLRLKASYHTATHAPLASCTLARAPSQAAALPRQRNSFQQSRHRFPHCQGRNTDCYRLPQTAADFFRVLQLSALPRQHKYLLHRTNLIALELLPQGRGDGLRCSYNHRSCSSVSLQAQKTSSRSHTVVSGKSHLATLTETGYTAAPLVAALSRQRICTATCKTSRTVDLLLAALAAKQQATCHAHSIAISKTPQCVR